MYEVGKPYYTNAGYIAVMVGINSSGGCNFCIPTCRGIKIKPYSTARYDEGFYDNGNFYYSTTSDGFALCYSGYSIRSKLQWDFKWH